MQLIVKFAETHSGEFIWGADEEWNAVRVAYQRFCKKNMSDLDPKLRVDKTHNFRKTRMTHLHDVKISVQAISKLVKHKSIETTFRYLEIPDE